MKLMFSRSAAKFADWAKAYPVLLLSVIFFGSCKKEILTDSKPYEVIAETNGSSLKPISYSDFLQHVDLNKIGNIGKVFQTSPKGSSLRTDVLGEQDYQFEIETSQVMQVKMNGHTSYVFPLKLSSKYSRSFSNLTIDINDGIVKTFINTYTPTDKWINDWRNKKLIGAFDGEVSYQEIPNDFAGLKGKIGARTMSIECFSWMETYPEAYPCDSDDRHMPWEACAWAGQERGPGYRIAYQMKTVCYSGGGGGGTVGGGDPIGGGGGTGEPITNPFPPSTYQPCGEPPSRPRPGIPPCEEPTLVEHLIYNLGITDVSQINFLNSPLRRLLVEQLSDHLHFSNGSLESQYFVRWVIEFLLENPDVSFSELQQMNNISNSSIILPNIIDLSELTPYPAFKSIVEDLPAFLTQNPEVMRSLSRYTGFSTNKIMQLLQPGKGPKIELVSNLVGSQGQEAFGQYDRDSKKLRIKKELVVGLEKVQSPSRYRALGMLLAIVTLHEFVHYGRDVNKLTSRIPMNGTTYEAGLIFELSISPPYNYNYIDRNNAIEWANFYKFNVND